jgi:hypothetical protein
MNKKKYQAKVLIAKTQAHVEETLKLKPSLYALGFRNGLALANHVLQGRQEKFEPWTELEFNVADVKAANPEPNNLEPGISGIAEE